jgi:tetratricopeptide (TPR) repeat protein
VGSLQEAQQVIDEHKPMLVLSDFTLKGGSGFDLFSHARKHSPELKEATLILITANISQSAVAKAAEEDVDSFIIKPYTVQSLEKSLITAVIMKLYPSKYIQTIEKGKEQLFSQNYEEALVIFEEAIKMNPKPSLAHFYHGQAKYLMQLNDEAEGAYKKGLTLNNIHYKCQIGLYELLKKEDRHKDAYKVVKNIAKYFPANPDRLAEVVRLCMVTENYADMIDYYNIFLELEERTDDIVNYICSGMYIYGKYSMLQKQFEQARDVFDKVGVSSAGKTKFLRAMIIVLVENEFESDAQKLVSRFPAESRDSEDYLVASFIAEYKTSNNHENIQKGLEVYNSGIRDYLCMKILIDAMIAEELDIKAQPFIDEMCDLWPSKSCYESNIKKAA